MKRVLFIWCLVFGMSVCSAYADVGSLQFSGGVVVPYDVSESDTGVGWQLSYAIGVTDHVEIGAMFMKSGYLEAKNDITEGEVEITTLLIQGRWLFNPADKTRGFMDFGFGGMDVDAETPSAIANRAGGAARIGFGVDRELSPHLAVRLSAGYTTGVGRTSEIDIIDASVSLVFGVRLLQ